MPVAAFLLAVRKMLLYVAAGFEEDLLDLKRADLFFGSFPYRCDSVDCLTQLCYTFLDLVDLIVHKNKVCLF